MPIPPEFHPSIVPLKSKESLTKYVSAHTTSITPPFPNWEKSFISGNKGTLFTLDHRIDKQDSHFLFSQIQFNEQTEGPPGHVHGGATAALIDELMGIIVWHNQFLCVTQTLQLFYWKAIPLTKSPSQAMIAVTELQKSTENKVEVRCTIYDQEKVAYVSATATFHRLTPEQFDKFMVSKTIA